MYRVKAYRTDHYEHETQRSFRDLSECCRWAAQFLADGGKVIVFCVEKRTRWSRFSHLRRIFEWTDPGQPLRREGYVRS